MSEQDYVSPEHLFHFVGRRLSCPDEQFQCLLKILRDGVISHPPHDKSWGKRSLTLSRPGRLSDGDLIYADMTCFADIPVGALGIHISKYSPFGLSFPRRLLLKHGARPVMYLPYWGNEPYHSPYGDNILADIEAADDALNQLVERIDRKGARRTRLIGATPTEDDKIIELAQTVLNLHFMAFAQPFDPNLPKDDPNNHYMEREWRKLGNMMFGSEDVGHVFVPKGYEDALSAALPSYAPSAKVIVVAFATPERSRPG